MSPPVEIPADDIFSSIILYQLQLIDHNDTFAIASIFTARDYRRVWVPDTTEGFLPAWIKSPGVENDQDSTAEVVIASSGETRTIPIYSISPMNPPQFDGVEDIADLTHLNEASVINNLRLRYGAGDIYVSLCDSAPCTSWS